MSDMIRDVLEAHTPSLIDPERCRCGAATPHWESFENHQAEAVREALTSDDAVERLAAAVGYANGTVVSEPSAYAGINALIDGDSDE